MLVAAVAAMALTAVTAGAASASTVAAKFSTGPEFYIKAPTGVTLKKNGGSAKACTMANIKAFEVSTSEVWGSNGGSSMETTIVCSGSP